MRRSGIALALFALAPATAMAANAERARTPALFTDTPCMTVIDKAEQPEFHVEYAVPADDLELTDDELPNSRRMQFFGFAEQRWDYGMPTWINQADFDVAEANGDIEKVYTDDDILTKSPGWAPEAWVRITPDDDRLPITLERAAMGIEWDLTDVPIGTWLVQVYTWEPEQNLWSFRFGAIRIEDSLDSENTPGPSAFVLGIDESAAMVQQEHVVRGCIEATEGSTYTASWGRIEGNLEPNWIDFALEQDVPENGDFELDWIPPEAAGGAEVKLRFEVEEPDGKRYVAYAPAVIPVTCPGGCEDETDSDESESESAETTGSASESVGDDTNPYDDDDSANAYGDSDSGGGFGCRSSGAPAPIAAALILFLLGLSRRGRRRC